MVPALVHDGTVITESNDILLYLENAFPDPGFRAVSSDRQSEIDYWLKMSGDLHIPGIKTFQYYKLNAALLEKTDEELALYRKLQTDPDLLAFQVTQRGQAFPRGRRCGGAGVDEYSNQQEGKSGTAAGWSDASYPWPHLPGRRP